MTHDDLIAQLEAATEGSFDLDSEIWDTLGTGPLGLTGKPRSILRYTESLDAALTLVPEGCRIQIEQSINGAWFDATIFLFGEDDEFIGDTPSGVKTAALAVCIAALRALAAATKNPLG